jgi:endonuclease/exonuclease/phosphatase family metal-dependent hydrolase
MASRFALPVRARFRLSSLFLLVFASAVGGDAERPLVPRPPRQGVFHFTIQTFNVEFRHWSDPSTLAAVAASNADIICLQETTPSWQRALTARYAAQYPYMLFHVRGEDSSGGLAVLSRFPLSELVLVREPHDWHPAWRVAVDTPSGRIQLLNVHLRAPLNGHPSAVTAYLKVNRDHLDEIARFSHDCTGGPPTIVLGDFNEGGDGSAIRYLQQKSFRNVLPLYEPHQWTWRHPSVIGQFTRSFDHILVDSRFVPLDAHAAPVGNSDHIPVVAHLELPRGPQATEVSAIGPGRTGWARGPR